MAQQKDLCKRADFTNWMKNNIPRWRDPSLAKALTNMGTAVSHTSVGNWRKGITRPKNVDLLNNLSELAGFRAELFFLTAVQEEQLEELLVGNDPEEALKIIFDYL